MKRNARSGWMMALAMTMTSVGALSASPSKAHAETQRLADTLKIHVTLADAIANANLALARVDTDGQNLLRRAAVLDLLVARNETDTAVLVQAGKTFAHNETAWIDHRVAAAEAVRVAFQRAASERVVSPELDQVGVAFSATEASFNARRAETKAAWSRFESFMNARFGLAPLP